MHLEDDKKGEQILLFTTSTNISRDSLIEKIRSKNISELYLPKHIVLIEEIPVLATGKTNYRVLLEMAENYIKSLEGNV
jgi:acyl-[acyl-carrier-protein]-phospholipid O-acyltransferase/long-chain-fatty-acid--[acyl-carrier-protein] ligase